MECGKEATTKYIFQLITLHESGDSEMENSSNNNISLPEKNQYTLSFKRLIQLYKQLPKWMKDVNKKSLLKEPSMAENRRKKEKERKKRNFEE